MQYMPGNLWIQRYVNGHVPNPGTITSKRLDRVLNAAQSRNVKNFLI